jgi:hypothetical protein
VLATVAALNHTPLESSTNPTYAAAFVSAHLQSALSPSVATPMTAAAWAPHIATLKAVKALLTTLSAAMTGPLGVVGGAVDVATDAANDVLGFATGGAVNVNGLAGLVQTGLNLLGRIPGL